MANQDLKSSEILLKTNLVQIHRLFIMNSYFRIRCPSLQSRSRCERAHRGQDATSFFFFKYGDFELLLFNSRIFIPSRVPLSHVSLFLAPQGVAPMHSQQSWSLESLETSTFHVISPSTSSWFSRLSPFPNLPHRFVLQNKFSLPKIAHKISSVKDWRRKQRIFRIYKCAGKIWTNCVSNLVSKRSDQPQACH